MVVIKCVGVWNVEWVYYLKKRWMRVEGIKFDGNYSDVIVGLWVKLWLGLGNNSFNLFV